MIENQFIYAEDIAYEDSGIADKIELKEAEHQYTVKEACDKLNQLHQENQLRHLTIEKLKKEKRQWQRTAEDYSQLNSRITVEKKELQDEIRELQEANHTLYNDNTRIILLIQEAYNSERTEIGKSVLRQLLAEVNYEQTE